MSYLRGARGPRISPIPLRPFMMISIVVARPWLRCSAWLQYTTAVIGRALEYGIMYVGHTARRYTVLPRQIHWDREIKIRGDERSTRSACTYIRTCVHAYIYDCESRWICNDISIRYMTLTESGLRQSSPGTMLGTRPDITCRYGKSGHWPMARDRPRLPQPHLSY
ncbi:hypothetical protein F4781DRAFT_326623 [Annulohypoxylon bovei var. microspora]|nr:hypothetical protein F4781DRAFT_326623 [Annulohypoxylon bovei var. microspora]